MEIERYALESGVANLIVSPHAVHEVLVAEGRDEMVVCPVGVEIIIGDMGLFLQVRIL